MVYSGQTIDHIGFVCHERPDVGQRNGDSGNGGGTACAPQNEFIRFLVFVRFRQIRIVFQEFDLFRREFAFGKVQVAIAGRANAAETHEIDDFHRHDIHVIHCLDAPLLSAPPFFK